MSDRQQALQSWLAQESGFKNYQLTPLAGDASFRCYFRMVHGEQSYIVMDAPPERESCVSFIAIANALRKTNLKTPEIFASDLSQGFLLLTDFGDRLYLQELTPQNAKTLYQVALDDLSILQGCQKIEGLTLPHFTTKFMRQEMDWFKEWFLVRYLNLAEQEAETLNSFFDWLTITSGQQPYVLMHRDYHSANLMMLPESQLGILDFQDAFIGPVTYDLASLLRDCYIAWPEQLVNELALYYLNSLQNKGALLNVKQDEFLFWFDCMSMQRHLKALITFSRKYIRDGNASYLRHIPRTLDYLLKVSERHPQSKILNTYLINSVIPAFETVKDMSCAQ